MDHAKLIAEIDAHLEIAGYGDDRFGALAANNGRLMKRLRAGKRIWPDTEMKIRIYLANFGETAENRRMMMMDISTASPSVGAWKCEPMTVAQIDAHPDRDRIWATIKAMQDGHDEDVESQIAAKDRAMMDKVDAAEDSGYDRGRKEALGDVTGLMDEWLGAVRKELDGLK